MDAPFLSVESDATLVEIAKVLGITKRSVERRAEKESWPFEEVPVRGGRQRLYPLATLPVAIADVVNRCRQAKLAVTHPTPEQRAIQTLTSALAKIKADEVAAADDRQLRAEAALRELAGQLSEREALSLRAHCDIAQGWKIWFAKRQPMRRSQSWSPYAEAYNLGEIPIAREIRLAYLEVSPRSVQRWVLDYEKADFSALVDHRNGDSSRGKTIFSSVPLLAAAAKKILVERPGIKTENLHALLETASVDGETGEILFTAPSYHQVYRFQKAWIAQNSELYLQMTNPDAWKNKAMVAYGNASEDVTALNQRWEMDATPADWLLMDPDGKKRRYTVSCVIDVYSRRALVVVARTPKTQTHCYALRLALLLWGVPQQIVTDNGADYQATHFKRVLNALDIDHRTTAPFSGEEKPHIERFIGTLNHSILEVLPNFAGHNVAERKAIEARRSFAERLARKGEIVDFADVMDGSCTGDFLQARINEWLTGIYEQREHGGIKTTPFARSANWTGEVRRISDVRSLDILLSRPAGNNGRRTVQKKGIYLDGAWFSAPALARVQTGHQVDIFETEDLGRIIVHYEGEFVCIAECPERTGASRSEIAAMAEAEQKLRLKEARRRLKEETKGGPDVDVLLARRLREKAAAAGKLVQPGFGSSTHDSHGMRQAAQAARALDDKPADQAGGMVVGGIVMSSSVPRPSAEIKALPMPLPRSERPSSENYADWLEIDQRIAAGEAVSADEARWHTSYQNSAQFRVESRKQAVAVA